MRRAWLHWVEAAGQPRSRGVLPLAGTYLAVDSLAGLFTVVAGAVVAAVAVYGIGYAAGHGAHGLGSRTAQMVLPLFALTLVLVLAEHRERASVRPAGVWYVVMTHLGLVLLLAGFTLFATEAGDESFITLRALPDPARLKAIGEDIREIAGLAFGHSTVRDRFTGTASLHKAAGRQIGCLGYVARAGGLAADARISHPFTAYSAGLDVPVQDNGDVSWPASWYAPRRSRRLALIGHFAEGLHAPRAVSAPQYAPGTGPRTGVGLVEGWRDTIATRVELAPRRHPGPRQAGRPGLLQPACPAGRARGHDRPRLPADQQELQPLVRGQRAVTVRSGVSHRNRQHRSPARAVAGDFAPLIPHR